MMKSKLKLLGKNCIAPVLRLLFFPVALLYKILSSISEGITTLFRNVKKDISEKYKERRKQKENTKNIKKYSEHLFYLFHLNVPLFETTFSDYPMHLFIYALQTISFFTTWAGATYYFAGIIDLGVIDGAILLPIVIQGVIIVCSNPNRSFKSMRRWFVMALFVVVSISFSYVGTVNNSFPPQEKYTSIYKAEVYQPAQSLMDIIRATTNNNDAVSSIEGTADIFEKDISQISVYIEKFTDVPLLKDESITPPKTEYTWGTIKNPDGTTTTGNVIPHFDQAAQDRYDQQKQKNDAVDAFQKSAKPGDLAELLGTFKEKYPQSKIQEILQSYSEEQAATDGLAKTEYESLIHDYTELITEANAVISEYNNLSASLNLSVLESISTDHIQDITEKLSTSVRLDSVEIPSSSDIQKEFNKSSTSSALNEIGDSLMPSQSSISNDNLAEENISEVRGPTSEAQNNLLERIRKMIEALQPNVTSKEYNNIVDAYYNNAQSILDQLNKIVENVDALKDSDKCKEQLSMITSAIHKFDNKDDANWIAFSNIFDKNAFSHTIVPLLLAILIDGGTLLLAWISSRKRTPHLHAKYNRDYVGREQELFEQVFFALNPNFINITLSISSAEDDASKQIEEYFASCVEAMRKTIETMQEFLKKFKYSPETTLNGCNLSVKSVDLDQGGNNDFLSLISVLSSMGYLVHLSAAEYAMLQAGPSASQEVIKEKIRENEDSYYFLKVSAENYLRQSITSDSIYCKFIELCKA